MKNLKSSFKHSLKKTALTSSLLLLGSLGSISHAASQQHMDMAGMDHSQHAVPVKKPSIAQSKVASTKPKPASADQHAGHGVSDAYAGHSMPASPAAAPMNMPDMQHGTSNPSSPSKPTAAPKQAAVDEHAGHDMSATSGMSGIDVSSGSMQHQHGSSQSRQNARSADYSQGRGYGPLHPPHMMADDILYGMRLNSLEWARDSDTNSNGFASSGSLWLGTDANRAVLGWELGGEKQLDDAALQLVWRRPLSTFWNYDMGVRTDYQREGADRQWLAFNLNGFAPYRFELNATALVGDKGRTALKLDADYDLRITQRLVLQPELSANLYGKNDLALNLGSGISDISATFRLRYDINRQFAPYLGFQYTKYVGNTADLVQAANMRDSQSRLMAGIRFWF